MHPLFSFYSQNHSTKPEIYRLTFTTTLSIPNISIFHFFFNINFLFRYFINLNTGEAVLNIIAQASGFTKLIFMRSKTRNPMSSPIPEHENSRFWLFRDKYVIVEAVLNINVQATAFARVFFSTWRFKKLKSNWLPQNWVFFNHPSAHDTLSNYRRRKCGFGAC